MTNEEKAVELVKQFNSCMNNGVSRDAAVMACLMEMAEWKDKEFWSVDNIEKIIVTYKSFPDRSCPHELVRKTIEKLKPENTK